MTNHEPVVFIVDDEPAVRDSLTLMLEQADISVQSFESADVFLSAYLQDCVGCIIIDVNMPGMNGMQLQEELSRRENILPVIFLTGHGNIPMSVKAIKGGAMDFLTKPVTRKKLINSVRSALLESKKDLNKVEHNHDALLSIEKLTEREREVMNLAVKGASNKVIASRLGISHRTVEVHKSKIMQKTGAVHLIDLVHIAHESGLDE
tara:strand:+ start:1172 stop:1789 length:618 start_codon:yes stop_codon:yes gene_type:complete